MTKSRGIGQGVGGGAPPKYSLEIVRIAKAMAKLGATQREIALAVGVTEKTFSLWMHEKPKLSAAVKPGKRAADERVERSLYQRATGYSFDSEKIFQYEGEEVRVPYVEHVPPSDTAMIFWLKNRRRDRWRDFKATELSTPPGKPIEIKGRGIGEPELIGEYFRRLGILAAATGSSDGADTGTDSGVGEGGSGTTGQGSDPETDQG